MGTPRFGIAELDTSVGLTRTSEGFIEVVEDSSQGKQVRKALETERLILRDILEDTLAGYWDWDIPNNREYLSPTFKKMFGYEDHELPNSPETWQRCPITMKSVTGTRMVPPFGSFAPGG
jgi:PAS domain-containing protein